MSTIPLPVWYQGNDLNRALQSLLDYDQFDDWLADPIYYADVAAQPAALLAKVKKMAAEHAVSRGGTLRFDVFGGGRKKFSAAALPLDLRTVLADVTSAEAPQLQRNLQNDFVFGYKYQSSAQAYNHDWRLDVFGQGYQKLTAYDPCSAGDRTSQPSLMDGWNELNTSIRPRSIFTAGGEGLMECLDQVAGYLDSPNGKQSRSVGWCDTASFYPGIRRSRLIGQLTDYGSRPGFGAFVDGIFKEAAGESDTGIASADDSLAFVANFYLRPVDDALTKAGVKWLRFGDEYFVLGTTADSVKQAFSNLDKSLASLGLQRNTATTAVTTVNFEDGIQLQSLSDNCVFDHAEVQIDGFTLYVMRQASSLGELIGSAADRNQMVSTGTWTGELQRILGVAAGQAPLNITFQLVRSLHYARREDCLRVPGADPPGSARAGKYRQTIGQQAWLPGRLAAQLKAARAGQMWWRCGWLLDLTSDLGPAAEPVMDDVQQLAADARVPPALQARALLTIARAGQAQRLNRVKDLIKPGGDFAGRASAVAAYFLDARTGSHVLSGFSGGADPLLVGFLNSTLNARRKP